MGVRKKHHYVPVFYLKRFSVNEEGKAIGLYNHKKGKFIPNAPLKHQACEDFLYGEDDEVEIELGKLESTIAIFFHHWTNKRELFPPPEDSPGFTLLKRFILYQVFRTLKMGEDIMESVNQTLQAYLMVSNHELLRKLEGSKVVHSHPALLALMHAADKEYYLNFLSCKFIVNLSPLSFISSDAPVIRYNQFLEQMGNYIGATGFAVKGLQIFYPIHPRLMICLYDPQVYNCGERNRELVSTESMEDIHQLNALQYLNSNSQMFFDETISQEYCQYMVEQCGVFLDKRKSINEPIEAKEGNRLLFSSFEDPQIELLLTFFSTLEDAKDVNMQVAPLRHPSLARK